MHGWEVRGQCEWPAGPQQPWALTNGIRLCLPSFFASSQCSMRAEDHYVLVADYVCITTHLTSRWISIWKTAGRAVVSSVWPSGPESREKRLHCNKHVLSCFKHRSNIPSIQNWPCPCCWLLLRKNVATGLANARVGSQRSM